MIQINYNVQNDMKFIGYTDIYTINYYYIIIYISILYFYNINICDLV